jgi:enamine deaminase RidA (YjgF/YER057c/UK114 family)
VTSVNTDEERAGLAPTPGYRYADVVGDRLYVAGQVPRDAAGELAAPGDPIVQATTCLDNLRILLDVHDFQVADVRRLAVYVVGERENLVAAWGAVTDWFGAAVPPATLLGVNALGYHDQVVEIDATVERAAGRT